MLEVFMKFDPIQGEINGIILKDVKSLITTECQTKGSVSQHSFIQDRSFRIPHSSGLISS